MQSNLKRQLRELLLSSARRIDPLFELDPSLALDDQLVAVRRNRSNGQWQFVALSFSTIGNRFFVEVAYSPIGAFPIDRVPLGPDSSPVNGMLRFRASSLWRTPDRSGGWLIWKRGDKAATDSIATPEGVFETPDAAMVAVQDRIVNWILPYLCRA